MSYWPRSGRLATSFVYPQEAAILWQGSSAAEVDPKQPSGHRSLCHFFLYLTGDWQLADAYSCGVENGICQRRRRWWRADFANPGRGVVIVQNMGFEQLRYAIDFHQWIVSEVALKYLPAMHGDFQAQRRAQAINGAALQLGFHGVGIDSETTVDGRDDPFDGQISTP